MEVGRVRKTNIRKRARMGPFFERGDQPHDFRRDQPKNGSRTDNAGTHPVARDLVSLGSGRMEHIGDTHRHDVLLDQGFHPLHEH